MFLKSTRLQSMQPMEALLQPFAQLFDGLVRGKGAVHRVDVADFGISRVGPPHPGHIGDGSSQLLPYAAFVFQNADVITEGLGHLVFAFRAHDTRRARQDSLRFGKYLARTWR